LLADTDNVFLTKDRMGFAAGDLQLYRYAGNGFTNGSDPSGNYLFFQNEKEETVRAKPDKKFLGRYDVISFGGHSAVVMHEEAMADTIAEYGRQPKGGDQSFWHGLAFPRDSRSFMFERDGTIVPIRASRNDDSQLRHLVSESEAKKINSGVSLLDKAMGRGQGYVDAAKEVNKGIQSEARKIGKNPGEYLQGVSVAGARKVEQLYAEAERAVEILRKDPEAFDRALSAIRRYPEKKILEAVERIKANPSDALEDLALDAIEIVAIDRMTGGLLSGKLSAVDEISAIARAESATLRQGDEVLQGISKRFSPNERVGRTLDAIQQERRALQKQRTAPTKGKPTFPADPNDFTKQIGVPPSKVATTKDGTVRMVWEPNANTRIRFESHPEGLKPGDPGFNPRHHGEHYHIEIKPDGLSWGQAERRGLVTKVKPEGYSPGDGTGLVPGEPFPGK